MRHPEYAEAGDRLWRSITDRFELEEHEAVILREACRVADLLDRLHVIVEAEGEIVDGKLHPAVVEARQARLALARLIAALRLPEDDDAHLRRPQRRGGARRPQALRGVS